MFKNDGSTAEFSQVPNQFSHAAGQLTASESKGKRGVDDDGKANYIQQIFKYMKFSGDLSQDIYENFKVCEVDSRKCDFSLG